MIPNAWFYKLRDMSKTTTTNHHNKPPSASYYSSPTTTTNHHNYSPKFKHSHHDPIKTSSKRSIPNRKTIYKPSPKHTESTHIVQDLLHSPVITQSRLSSTYSDIIIDANGTKMIDFYPEMELQLPQIITKPTKSSSRKPRDISSQQPKSKGSTLETSTWDDSTTVIGNSLVKSAVCDPSITSVSNLSQIRYSTYKDSTPFSVGNSSVTTITDKLPSPSETSTLEDFTKDIGNPMVKPVVNDLTSVGNMSQIKVSADKNLTTLSIASPSVTTITDSLATDVVLSDTPLFCTATLSNKKIKEDNQNPDRKSISGVKLRSNSPKLAMTKRTVEKFDCRKNLSQSYAVVKSSYNPAKDFMQSMMEMITENKITSSKDLEELLACYLALNSDEYHDVIVKAFEQIWHSLPDV